MSTVFAMNYSLDTTTANNSFSALWKLSRCMKKAGWTYKASGDGTNKDTTGTAANDKWGGNADPMLDTYGAGQLDSRAAWWCSEGPSTVKLGISGPSVGTFLRGEIVTQATSGATGEVLGYVINAAGTSGWMIIQPQTGTFDGTHQVTGASSGATVTPTSYNLIRRQIVFAKAASSVTVCWIFYQALSDTEIAASSNTALFSDLAANAVNCTATVAPGNSASGSNRFPSYGIALLGTAESTGQSLFDGVTSSLGKAQMAAVNATASAGVSPDGSFFAALYDSSGAVWRHFSFQRLDDTEPGDADPYAWAAFTTESVTGSAGRTAGTPSNAVSTWSARYGIASGSPAKGYCARTTGTMGVGVDSFSAFGLCVASIVGSTTTAQAPNAASTPRTRNHPDAGGSPPMPIEPFVVISTTTGLTMRKGVCRYLGVVPVGAMNDTADTKQWLIVLAQSGAANPAVAIGPLDGSTTPVTT